MRKILPLALLAAQVFAWQMTPIAPEFAIHMAQGPDLRLSSYRGKVVLLALLNTGCQHCQHFAQELQGLQKDYKSKGVQVLAAVFDKEAKAGLEAFRTKYASGYPLGYSDEGTVVKWIGPAADQGYFVPIVAFVDKRGRIAGIHLGDDNLFQDPETNIRRELDRLTKK